MGILRVPHISASLIIARAWILAVLLLCRSTTATAQTNSALGEKSASAQITFDAKQLAKNFAHDQVQIFESPVRVAHKPSNLVYLVPFVIAGALIPADRHIEPNPSTSVQNAAQDISNVGLIGTAATVGGLYLYGVAKHDDHAHEAGKLGTQSFVDTFLVYELANVVAGRARPDEGNGHGDFFVNHSFGSSFPSGHASLTWSMSTVLADEYPSTKSRLFWYAVGSTVAASRVVGRRHFTSDVVVGSAIGYLIGRYVFHAHGRHLSKGTRVVKWPDFPVQRIPTTCGTTQPAGGFMSPEERD
jgi:membrane-associated phospholipid phosphatase